MCIFCKIISGEIPNHTVYEDDYILAFLDIHPCAKGHTVIIPKQHYENLAGLPLEEWNNLTLGIKNSLKKVEEVLKPDAVNIAINDRKVAGQVVPHVHWHIIPRWDCDGGGSLHSIIKNSGEMEVGEVAKLF